MRLIRSHDALVRFVFGEPEQMADLLQAFLPAAIVDAVDWSTLRRADGELLDKALRERRTDLVFLAAMGDRTLVLQFLHEHKSAADPYASLQLGGYSIRLLERWRLRHPDLALPAVVPFVVHHGEQPWGVPQSLAALVDLSRCAPDVAAFLLPLQVEQRFLVIDFATLRPDRVEALRLSAISELTVRFLQFLRGAPPEQLADHVLAWASLVHAALAHPRGQDVLSALFSWWLAGAPATSEALAVVMTKIQQENPPMRSLLDMVLDLGEERGVQKGVQRGRRQGLQKGLLTGRRALLREQLVVRFGPLPSARRRQLAAADAETLQRWGIQLLTARTLAAVFAD